MNSKFTVKKLSFGVSKEFEFMAKMDIEYHLQLENLNNTDNYSVVDFRIPTTNLYIELKSRTCKSNAFETTLFDKPKIERWSRNKLYNNAIIYLAFYFIDGVQYFIKYNDILFKSFDLSIIEEWNNQINYKMSIKSMY